MGSRTGQAYGWLRAAGGLICGILSHPWKDGGKGRKGRRFRWPKAEYGSPNHTLHVSPQRTSSERPVYGGRLEADIVTDEAGRTVTMEYRSGPFTGRQTVAVSGRRLVATWDVRFRGFFRLASRWNEGHFRSGTRHALERLAAGAPRGEKV